MLRPYDVPGELLLSLPLNFLELYISFKSKFCMHDLIVAFGISRNSESQTSEKT